MTETYKDLKELLRGASEEAITDLAALSQIAEPAYTGEKYTTEVMIGVQRLGLQLIRMADSEPLKEIRNINKRKNKLGSL